MKESIETRCVHGDIAHRLQDDYRPLSFPIFQSAAFSHTEMGHNASGFDYTRETNPTRTRVEQVLTSLEGAHDSIALSSGMAAISTCLELFDPGDSILCSNDLYVDDYLKKNIPELKMVCSEGTYFAWIDCSELGLSSEELDNLIIHDAKLWLDSGHIFGGGAEQFQRIVVACPRTRLTEALDRLRDAVDSLQRSAMKR